MNIAETVRFFCLIFHFFWSLLYSLGQAPGSERPGRKKHTFDWSLDRVSAFLSLSPAQVSLQHSFLSASFCLDLEMLMIKPMF